MADAIQSLWIGNELSILEKLVVSSYLANGHEFHLYVYDDIGEVPEGTTLLDANKIIPKSEIFRIKSGSLAIFADWFRWVLLYEKGGYWVDMDVVCLRPFDFSEELIFGKQCANCANIAVMKFPPGHELCKTMADRSDDPNKLLPYDRNKRKLKKIARRIIHGKKARANVEWGETGPQGFTEELRRLNLFHVGKPFSYFYPIYYDNWKCIFDDTFRDGMSMFSNTYAIHFWNELARLDSGFDKNMSFPEGSMVEQLKRMYLKGTSSR